MQDHLVTILDFRKFRWVGTSIGSEVLPVRSPRYSRWQGKHSHHHFFREVLIGVSGRAHYGWKGGIYPVSPGTVLLFDSGEIHHNGYPSFASPCCHLWIHECVTEKDSSVLWNFCEVKNHRFVLPPSQGPFSGTSSHQFWRAWDLLRKKPHDAMNRGRFFLTLSALVMDLVASQTTLQSFLGREGDNVAERVVMEISNVIRHNLKDDLSLEHLARLSGYSKFHFLRIFKKYRRCSLSEYIHKLKVRRAIELLRDGVKSAQVSDELGFSSPSGFYRFFLQETGKRPSAYWRQRNRLLDP